MLKSIATTCDDDYWVVFKKDGGWIIDTNTKQRTAFQRVGNSYVLDVWVFVPNSVPWNTVENGRKTGFSRPSAP